MTKEDARARGVSVYVCKKEKDRTEQRKPVKIDKRTKSEWGKSEKESRESLVYYSESDRYRNNGVRKDLQPRIHWAKIRGAEYIHYTL